MHPDLIEGLRKRNGSLNGDRIRNLKKASQEKYGSRLEKMFLYRAELDLQEIRENSYRIKEYLGIKTGNITEQQRQNWEWQTRTNKE